MPVSERPDAAPAGARRLLTWSRRRTAYLLVALTSFALTEIGRDVYRPLVYRHGVDDWGIADTMGNHLGAVALIFAILAVQHATRADGFLVVAVVSLGYVAYEGAQTFLPGSTPDPRDAVASLIGGVLAAGILTLVCRWTPPPPHETRAAEGSSSPDRS